MYESFMSQFVTRILLEVDERIFQGDILFIPDLLPRKYNDQDQN